DQQSSSSQSEPEQRAIRSAKDALKAIDLRGYRFVVLSDPKGSGFLVYALATSRDPEEIADGIHYRVSVSADASRAERVDALSRTMKFHPQSEATRHPASHRSSCSR